MRNVIEIDGVEYEIVKYSDLPEYNGDDPCEFCDAWRDGSGCTVTGMGCDARHLLKRVTPPLGIKPRYIHNLDRMQDIVDAMKRKADNGEWPLPEWVEELNDLVVAEMEREGNK
jgi:hypothetical protein